MKGKKVLVTGAAGFVGSHLSEALVQAGAEVVALDDLSNGHKNFVPVAARFVEASVEDKSFLSELIRKENFDFVFHLAALNLLRSIENPIRDLAINGAGTLVILEALSQLNRARSEPARMIYSSSGSVYGEPRYSPQDEEHPRVPVSPYGISKLAGENYTLLWHKVFGVPGIALRYYNVYGPRQSFDQKGGVVGIFLSRALKAQSLYIEGDGKQDRCFTFVSDVVNANLLSAAAKPEAWGRAYNIGTTEITTVGELAVLVNQQCNSNAKIEYLPPRIGDVRSFQPRLNLAEEFLDYRPAVRFKDGLQITKTWLSSL